jgi:isoamylase
VGAERDRVVAALPGIPFPLGATIGEGGTNFAVASGAADGIVLCLFEEAGAETQLPLRDYDAGVWHDFVPGPARATPTDPGRPGPTTRLEACAATLSSS